MHNDRQENMGANESSLTASDRHSLFTACAREAGRLGGDERCAEYFFVRAQSSRVRCANNGAVSVADMNIEDWCDAIAWSAPGLGRPPKRASARPVSEQEAELHPELDADAENRKQPRLGAKSKRASQG